MQKYGLTNNSISLSNLQKMIQNRQRKFQCSTNKQKMPPYHMSFNSEHRERLDEYAYQQLRKTSNQFSELNVTLPFYLNDHSVLNKPCKCPFHNRYQKNSKFCGLINSKNFQPQIFLKSDKKYYRHKTQGNKEYAPSLLFNSALSKNNNRKNRNSQINQWNHKRQISSLWEQLSKKKQQSKNCSQTIKLLKQKKFYNTSQTDFKQRLNLAKINQKQIINSVQQTKDKKNVPQAYPKKEKYLSSKLKKKRKQKDQIKSDLKGGFKQEYNQQPSLTVEQIQTAQKLFNEITDQTNLMDQNTQNRRNAILQTVIKSKLGIFEHFMGKLRQRRMCLVQILNSDHTNYNQSKVVTLKINNIDGIHSAICQKSKLLKQTLRQWMNGNRMKPSFSEKFTNNINQHIQVSQTETQQARMNNQKIYQEIQRKLIFLQLKFTLQDKEQQQRLLRISQARRMPIISNSQQKQNEFIKWKNRSDMSESGSLKRNNGIRKMNKFKTVKIIKDNLSKSDSLSRQSLNSQQQESHSSKKYFNQIRSFGYLQPFPMKKRRLLKSFTSGINRQEIKQKINDATDFLLSHIKTPKSNKLRRNKQEKSSSEQSLIQSNQIQSNISISFSDDQGKTQKSIKYYIYKKLHQTKLCRRVSKHLGQKDLGKFLVKPDDSIFKIKKKLSYIHSWANKQYSQQLKDSQLNNNNSKTECKNNRIKNQHSYRRLMDYVQLFQKYCYLGVKGYQEMFQYIKKQKLKKQMIQTKKKVLFAKQSSLKQEMQEIKNCLNSKDKQLKFLQIEGKQNQNESYQKEYNFRIYSYQTYRNNFSQNLKAKEILKEQQALSQICMEKEYVIQPPCEYKPENHFKIPDQVNKQNNAAGNAKIILKLPHRAQKFSETEIKQILRHALGRNPNFMSTLISQTRSISYSDILLNERLPMLLNSKQSFKQNQSIVDQLKTSFNDSSIIQKSSNDFLKSIQNWDASLLNHQADKKRNMSTKWRGI